MPGGRPTKYNKDILAKANEYLLGYKDAIPSVVGLVKYIGISRACINRWGGEDDKKEFKDILEEIQETQELVLIDKGLKGEFNSNITKLVLGKHGYHDKTDNTHSGPDGKAIETKTLLVNGISPKKD